MCFAVTEPNAGLNTTELKTRAERRDGGYLVNGEKIWISTAQVANKMLLLARTTPLDKVKRKTEGLSLFYTSLDRSKIEVRLIHKMGRHAVDSNMLFIQDLWIPDEDRIGPEGEGFKLILHGLNPERVLIAAEAIGIGRAAIARAARYARERIVFNRPIGMNQGIQHPLAKCWAQLEAANLMVMKAATLFDKGQECGVEANAGKYLAGEFAFEACHTAMLTLGRHGLCAGISCRTLLARMPDPADRADQPAHDPELPGREGAGASRSPTDAGPDVQARKVKDMATQAEGINARSWLFAPGDSERKMEKATASAADIILLDLEDAVAEGEKPKARSMVPAFLKAHAAQRARLWVRINPLQGPHALADLAAVVQAVPAESCCPRPAAGPMSNCSTIT